MVWVSGLVPAVWRLDAGAKQIGAQHQGQMASASKTKILTLGGSRFWTETLPKNFGLDGFLLTNFGLEISAKTKN